MCSSDLMYGLKTEVVIPEGVTEIGEGAFSCSHMPSVRFPSTLKKIGKQAFCLTFGLTNYSTITFPNGLEVIEDEAFDSCYFKNAVVLPASIKSIGKKAFYGYSYYGSGTLGAYFLGACLLYTSPPTLGRRCEMIFSCVSQVNIHAGKTASLGMVLAENERTSG